MHKKSLVKSEAKKKEIAEYRYKEKLINEAKTIYAASIASKNPADGIFLLFFQIVSFKKEIMVYIFLGVIKYYIKYAKFIKSREK